MQLGDTKLQWMLICWILGLRCRCDTLNCITSSIGKVCVNCIEMSMDFNHGEQKVKLQRKTTVGEVK